MKYHIPRTTCKCSTCDSVKYLLTVPTLSPNQRSIVLSFQTQLATGMLTFAAQKTLTKMLIFYEV